MKIRILEEQKETDDSMVIFLQIAKRDLALFGFLLESFEGWALYTTVDRDKDILRIDTPKDFYPNVKHFIDYLETWED